MFSFPVTLAQDDNGTVLVTSPAFPELATYGDTEDLALENAILAAEEAIAGRIAAGDDVPEGTDATEAHAASPCVRVGLQCSIKLLLYHALRAEGITRAELARRLGWHREQVDRLFRIDHASRFDQIDAAFRALGRDVELVMRRAA